MTLLFRYGEDTLRLICVLIIALRILRVSD